MGKKVKQHTRRVEIRGVDSPGVDAVVAHAAAAVNLGGRGGCIHLEGELCVHDGRRGRRKKRVGRTRANGMMEEMMEG